MPGEAITGSWSIGQSDSALYIGPPRSAYVPIACTTLLYYLLYIQLCIGTYACMCTGHGGEDFLQFQDAQEISNAELADAFGQMWQKRR